MLLDWPGRNQTIIENIGLKTTPGFSNPERCGLNISKRWNSW